MPNTKEFTAKFSDNEMGSFKYEEIKCGQPKEFIEEVVSLYKILFPEDKGNAVEIFIKQSLLYQAKMLREDVVPEEKDFEDEHPINKYEEGLIMGKHIMRSEVLNKFNEHIDALEK